MGREAAVEEEVLDVIHQIHTYAYIKDEIFFLFLFFFLTKHQRKVFYCY